MKRRFKNKMTFFLIVVLLIVFGFVGFCDVLIEGMKPDLFDPLEISLNVRQPDLFQITDDFIVSKQSLVQINEVDDGYDIVSHQDLSVEQELVLNMAIENYHQQVYESQFDQDLLAQYLNPNITLTLEKENTSRNHDLLFVFITTIYFMMIGFAALIAQEIVAEKTTNILELIGISISLKTHYYSKIIIGWLSVFLQVLVGLILASFVVVIRYLFDNGKGLISFLKKLQLIQIEQTSISELLEYVSNHQEMIVLLLISCVFLFVGILFIQMTLVLLTTKVQTIEEAGSIQSPFYIVLLVMYYVCMFLNNEASMTKGMGKLFSYVPVLSMIFMPSRILIYSPSNFEVIMSLVLSLVALAVLIKWGEKRYVSSVLDFSRISQSPVYKGHQ